MSIGASVHPTPSAGDGLVIEQSTSIPPAQLIDNVIRCAQCGFYVNLDRRATGDSLGAIPLSGSQISQTVNPPAPGTSFTDKYFDVVTPGSGCNFCGSLNPQANGRDDDPYIRVGPNLENA